MAAVVIKTDVGAIITGQPVLADLIDLGNGQTAFQLKTTGGGGGGGPVTQATTPWVVAPHATAIPWQVAGLPGALTDKSGTIAAGAVSQVLAAALATRRYIFVQNISGDKLWIDFGVAAVQDTPSIPLDPGDAFVMETNFISNQSVNIIGPTTGQKFVAKEG